jgi:16S rRNA (uracil1498-N3)-methyltransferase
VHVHLDPALAPVAVGDEVTVSGAEAHHAVVVRRLRVGEPVAVTDGRGRTAAGPIAWTTKRQFGLRVQTLTDEPAPEPAVVVVQAIPKGERGELAVELLTEVGVEQVVPWAASRCVAVWKGERGEKALTRWRSTAREAAKQARRSWFPEVTDQASTAEVVARVAAADLAVVLHEEASVPLTSLDVPTSGSVVVVVGPEGGLTPQEVAILADAGAHVVRLGPEVLRTSTAGLAAAAALLARTPRWR